jgi:hypothetical protein
MRIVGAAVLVQMHMCTYISTCIQWSIIHIDARIYIMYVYV